MRKLDEQIIGNAPATQLTRAQYQLLDGTVKDCAIVHRPMAAGVIALRLGEASEVQVLLIEQPRPAVNDSAVLEIVAGKMDVPGETNPRTTAARELAEEAGIHAATWRRLTGGVYTSPGYSDEHVHLFMAWELTTVPQRPEDAHIRSIWLPLTEAVKMVMDNRICDLKTRDAIFSVSHLLRTGELQGFDGNVDPVDQVLDYLTKVLRPWRGYMAIEDINAIADGLAETLGLVPPEDRCPSCNSPLPHLHPAVQSEGEVQPCPHPWHQPVSPRR